MQQRKTLKRKKTKIIDASLLEKEIGKGAGGTVHTVKGNSIVAKQWGEGPDKNEIIISDNMNETLREKSQRKRETLRDLFRSSMVKSKLKYYKDRIAFPEVALLTSKRDLKKEETILVSDYAQHGSLKDFLLKLVTKNESLNKIDKRILEAFRADPAKFMHVLIKKMHSCLDAFQDLQFIHVDVSARNFLVFEFKDADFEFDKNGNVIGLRDFPVKITDFGLSLHIKHQDEIKTISGRPRLPLKWQEQSACGENPTFSIMSDWYSFRATIITLMSLITGKTEESAFLYFDGEIIGKNGPEKKAATTTAEVALMKQEIENKQAMGLYLDSAENGVKETIIELRKKLDAYEKDNIEGQLEALKQLEKSYNEKIDSNKDYSNENIAYLQTVRDSLDKLIVKKENLIRQLQDKDQTILRLSAAESCITLIEAYRSYLIEIPELSKSYEKGHTPSAIKAGDAVLFEKVDLENAKLIAKGKLATVDTNLISSTTAQQKTEDTYQKTGSPETRKIKEMDNEKKENTEIEIKHTTTTTIFKGLNQDPSTCAQTPTASPKNKESDIQTESTTATNEIKHEITQETKPTKTIDITKEKENKKEEIKEEDKKSDYNLSP